MFVVVNEFPRFYVRFWDAVRGRIRILRTRNKENCSSNQRNMFDENCGLASTQSLRGEDPLEGDALGTILPSLGADLG
jgi:glutamate dehydrogenase